MEKGQLIYVYEESKNILKKDKISSVGNKYFALEKYNGKFYLDTLRIDVQSTSKHKNVRAFLTLEDFRKEYEVDIIFNEIKTYFQEHTSKDLSVDALRMIKKILFKEYDTYNDITYEREQEKQR